jgi:hypothetical protein
MQSATGRRRHLREAPVHLCPLIWCGTIGTGRDRKQTESCSNSIATETFIDRVVCVWERRSHLFQVFDALLTPERRKAMLQVCKQQRTRQYTCTQQHVHSVHACVRSQPDRIPSRRCCSVLIPSLVLAVLAVLAVRCYKSTPLGRSRWKTLWIATSSFAR